MEKFEDIYIYDEQIKIIVLNNDTRERFHNMHFNIRYTSDPHNLQKLHKIQGIQL